MTVLVHFSGPSYSKTAVLEPGAPAIQVGRDPQAGIHLPDQDRLISRCHVSIEWDPGGVKVNVLSKVNGVTTPRGEFTQGQSVVLAPGETAQVGRFSFVAEQRAGGAAAAPAAAMPDDPFHLFAAPNTEGPSRGSVFDDPFFTPARSSQPAQPSLPAALDAMSGTPSHAVASFSGGATDPGIDPLAAFGGTPAGPGSSSSIDEFLGAPSAAGGGLGAASLLRPASPGAHRLATDHVHDFALPVRAPVVVPAPLPLPQSVAAPAAPVAPPASAAPVQPEADPWAQFAKEWLPDDSARRPADFASPARLNHALDDAFSSSTAWHVDDMPAPDPHPSASSPRADEALLNAFAAPDATEPGPREAASGDAPLRALCRGLGIPGPQQLKEEDWEQVGRSVRQVLQGLSELMNARAELKREMRATDRTMLGAQENNPLKSGMQLDELLHYFLFMPQGAAGYMPAQRALDESLADLRAHEFASLAAVRAAVEGSIREFEPAKLRGTLLKGKRSMGVLDNARLWDLYSSHYEQRREHMADWLEQVFSRHFMPAYSREAERLRREAQSQSQPRPR
jgi:type VI secretion system FHA domain protein